MFQILILVGSLVFLFLGTLHGLLTLRDIKNPKAFTPRDPELRKAMQQSSVAFHRDLNLWDAWLGFNISHSLGIVAFGALFLHLGLVEPDRFAASTFLQAFSVIVPALYLATSLKLWFSRPTIGAAIGTACFALAVVLVHL